MSGAEALAVLKNLAQHYDRLQYTISQYHAQLDASETYDLNAKLNPNPLPTELWPTSIPYQPETDLEDDPVAIAYKTIVSGATGSMPLLHQSHYIDTDLFAIDSINALDLTNTYHPQFPVAALWSTLSTDTHYIRDANKEEALLTQTVAGTSSGTKPVSNRGVSPHILSPTQTALTSGLARVLKTQDLHQRYKTVFAVVEELKAFARSSAGAQASNT